MHSAWAQSSRRLEFVFADEDLRSARQLIRFEPVRLDSSSILDTLREHITQLQEAGFLSAGVDSLVCGQERCRAFWYLGPVFRIDSIDRGAIPRAVFEEAAGFLSPGQAYRKADINRASDRLVDHYMSHGYPFVKLALTPRMQAGSRVRLVFSLEPGSGVEFDSLRVDGDLLLHSSFLQPFLGIWPGAPYDHSLVQKISERLRNLPYASFTADPAVSIAGGKARVEIPARRRKASRFDFLLGILPDAGTGKILLSGQVQADLWNVLGYGERLQTEWVRTRPATQELKLSAAFPYLRGTPIGANGRFQLYKRDSLSLELSAEAGLQYSWPGGHYLKGYWQYNGASLLVIPSTQILAERRLPQVLDFRWHQFGGEAGWQNLDYRLNPRRGSQLWLKGGAGRKTILKNEEILGLSHDQTDFGAQYDSLDLQTLQFRLEALLQHFWPLGQRSTILGQLQGGLTGNSSGLLQNDLFRLGGYARLRGFDEQAIPAASFGIATLEYRFLLSTNAFFNVFADYALVDNTLKNSSYLGLGTGLSLETKAGIFNVSVAVGKAPGEGIAWQAAKVHVGYVSLF